MEEAQKDTIFGVIDEANRVASSLEVFQFMLNDSIEHDDGPVGSPPRNFWLGLNDVLETTIKRIRKNVCDQLATTV